MQAPQLAFPSRGRRLVPSHPPQQRRCVDVPTHLSGLNRRASPSRLVRPTDTHHSTVALQRMLANAKTVFLTGADMGSHNLSTGHTADHTLCTVTSTTKTQDNLKPVDPAAPLACDQMPTLTPPNPCPPTVAARRHTAPQGPRDGGQMLFIFFRAARAIPRCAEFVQFRAAQSAALPTCVLAEADSNDHAECAA